MFGQQKRRIGIGLVWVSLWAGAGMVSPAAGQDVKPFLGRWALYLPGGAGWLEVRQETGYLDADILWYGGSVVPVDSVMVIDDTLIATRNRPVVRKKDAEGKPIRTQTMTTWIELSGYGDELTGRENSPHGNGVGVTVREFTAKRIPALPARPNLSKVKYGQPIKLFNGKDLTGWAPTNPNQKVGFKVVDGALVNDPVQPKSGRHIRYGNLKTTRRFEDFKLTLQVNVPKGSNSGVYLRGIYEVQISDSYGRGVDSHNMGAIYSRLTPKVSAEKPAGQWQDMEMILCDRHVTVVLNGKTIIDNEPLLGVTGGALTADEFSPGPIYLQGDHGKISYRHMVLTPIIK